MQAAPTSHGSAFEVASSLLEITGKAIETGDFDTFAACFKLPQSLGTMDGIRKLTTRDDIRQVFDGVRRRYREMGLIGWTDGSRRRCTMALTRSAVHMSRMSCPQKGGC
jgi:hypothetical protein